MDFSLTCSKKGTELFIYTFISIKAFPPVAACMCHVISRLVSLPWIEPVGQLSLCHWNGDLRSAELQPQAEGLSALIWSRQPPFPRAGSVPLDHCCLCCALHCLLSVQLCGWAPCS